MLCNERAGRARLYGHVGQVTVICRYHDQFVTSFYDFLDPLSQTAHIRAAILAPNQFVEEYRFPTTARASIDPDTRFPYVEEFVAGLERQMPWGIAARVQYIGRQFKDSIGFTDPARTWLPVQAQDPGADGIRGTADDGGPMTVYFGQDATQSAPLLTNPPAYRRYQGVQLISTKRYTNNVQFQASYTWSRTSATTTTRRIAMRRTAISA